MDPLFRCLPSLARLWPFPQMPIEDAFQKLRAMGKLDDLHSHNLALSHQSGLSAAKYFWEMTCGSIIKKIVDAKIITILGKFLKVPFRSLS